MKMVIVALWDRKAQVFTEMWSSQTVGTATRQVQELVTNKDSGHAAAKWPADYELWHLGNYDTQTGAIESIDPQGEHTKKLLIHCETLKHID